MGKLKTRLLFGTAVTAVVMTSPSVTAQDGADDQLELEEIVVSGSRLSNRRAISQKRDAVIISDFLTSDDVGKLPDFNVADAIRRASGVNTIFDEDEGQFVALRGINADFTYTSFDGNSVPVADLGGFFGQGRRVLLETVPSGAVKTVAVNKTRTPGTDGQALGGHVDLRTRSAFDTDGMYLVGTGVIGYFDNQDVTIRGKQPSVRSEVTWSNTFGADDTFGVVLSTFYNRKKRDQQRNLTGGAISPGFYSTSDGTDLGDGNTATLDPNNFPLDRVYVENGYTNVAERYGGIAKLEFQPTENLYTSATLIYFRQDEEENRQQTTVLNGFGFCSPGCAPTGADANGLIFAGVDGNGDGDVLDFGESPLATARLDSWNHRKGLTHATYKLDYNFNDYHNIEANVVWAEAFYNIPNRVIIDGAPLVAIGPARTNHSGSIPFLEFDGPLTFPDGAAFTRYRTLDQQDSSEQFEASLDYSYDPEGGIGYVAGMTFRHSSRVFDDSLWQLSSDISFDQALDGNFITPGGSLPTLLFPRSALGDDNEIREIFNLNETVNGFTRVSFSDESGNDFSVEEGVFGAYAGLTFRGEKISGDAGLRYERTNTVVRPGGVRAENDYGNWLPSANFAWQASEEITVRAAYSKSLGRPGHSQIGVGASTAVGQLGTPVTTLGNPDLLPRTAHNFDVSVEYYFDEGDSLVSAALFHKDISNEIIPVTRNISPTNVVVILDNAESSDVTGIELNFVKNNLDFLPGAFANFGINANASFFWGSTTDAAGREQDLLEQPDYIINASLFYAVDRFEARLTWNYTGEQIRFGDRLGTFGAEFDRARNFLDSQVRYDINENVQVFAEVRNLLNEAEETSLVGSPDFVVDSSTFGRSMWLGATFSF